MEMQMLDWVLVPAGVGVLVAYHGWLLHRIIKQPTSTVVGINSINRRLWVSFMMEDTSKNGVLAVQTLRNNIMASTLMASTAIMMTSVIAVLMTPTRSTSQIIVGDRSSFASSIKFFCILSCFLVAFLLNVQSVRYYSHASFLVNVPFKKLPSPSLSSDYVAGIVNRGSYFWSLGLRAYYFSIPLIPWIFGPIPMFLSCIAMVFLLYSLDFTSEFRDRDQGKLVYGDLELGGLGT